MAHRHLAIALSALLVALLSPPTLAQDAGALDDGGASEADAGSELDDAGNADAGPVDCTPRCDGEILRFCDGDEPVALDCSETGATCQILSEEWGADCVLPPGADCDPGYADGLSRCAGAGDAPPSNCCVNNECGDPGDVQSCRAFLPAAPERPAAGGNLGDDDAASSCLGCEGIPLLSMAPLLVGLRLRRRRKD